MIDTIISEAAERNRLDGLRILVPDTIAADLVPESKAAAGQDLFYKGVFLVATPRIKSYSMVEVTYDKKTKETPNNG